MKQSKKGRKKEYSIPLEGFELKKFGKEAYDSKKLLKSVVSMNGAQLGTFTKLLKLNWVTVTELESFEYKVLFLRVLYTIATLEIEREKAA
jgi:hypothetical protein